MTRKKSRTIWAAGAKDWRIPLWVWALIAVVRVLVYASYAVYTVAPDTVAYTSFEWPDFFRLHFVENAAPPVYGMILATLRMVFTPLGLNYFMAVSLLQVSAGAVALVLFSECLRMVGVKDRLAAVILLFYGCQPAILQWDLTLMTESFSISAVIAVFYCFLRFLREERFCWGFWMLFGTMFLIYLRPQFLTYLAMLAAFLLLRCFLTERSGRLVYFQLLGVVAGCTCLILIYCSIYYRQFGVFSLTAAMPRQNLIICMEQGFYASSTDQRFVEAILESYRSHDGAVWPSMWPVLEEFGNARIIELTRECFALRRADYLEYLIQAAVRSVENSFAGIPLPREDIAGWLRAINAYCAGLFQWTTVGQAMLLPVLCGVATFRAWLRERQPPWVLLALFAISFTTVYPTFIVTCGEYMRTMISVLPYLYLALGMGLQALCAPGMGQRRAERR